MGLESYSKLTKKCKINWRIVPDSGRLLFGGNLAIQPAYENTEFKIPDKLEVSEYILNNTFWLGVYPGITNEMLDFVFESTCEFLKDNQWTPQWF